MVINIPSDRHYLEEDAGKVDSNKLPEEAIQIANDLRVHGYIGAAPPKGHGPHHHFVTVWVLDIDKIDVPSDATPSFVAFNMFGHILGKATLNFEVEIN